MRNLTKALVLFAFAGAASAQQLHQGDDVLGCNGATCYTTNNCGDEIGTARCYACCDLHCLSCATVCQDKCDERVFATAFDRFQDVGPTVLRDTEMAVTVMSSGWYDVEFMTITDAIELEWFYASAQDPIVARWALALAGSGLANSDMDDRTRRVLRQMLLDGLVDARSWKIRRVAVNVLGEAGMMDEPGVVGAVVRQAARDPDPEFVRHVMRVLSRL